MNPANHSESIFVGRSTNGLSTEPTSGKAIVSLSDKPQFIAALMATILRKPSQVKCSPLSGGGSPMGPRWSPPPPSYLQSMGGARGGEGTISSITSHHSSKSPCF